MQPSLLPYTPERDVYRLLGVPASASSDEINAACRRLARTFHPDRNRSERATAEMQVVNAVRSVMSDPESRAVYDRERHRFHARLSQPATGPMPPPMPPPMPAPRQEPASPSPILRYVRAAWAGAAAVVATLAPPRCRGCRAVVASSDDAYCVTCGTPLLTGG